LIGGWPLTDAVESEAIASLLFKDSDRAAAIVACTILEDKLEKKLQASLRNSSVFKSLFDVGRPLNFFEAKNQLAYLMKIYGKPFYQELKIIGQVRNKFAHLYAEKGQAIKAFNSPIIKGLCDELSLMEKLLKAEAKQKEDLGLLLGLPSWAKKATNLEGLKNPRIRYVNTCGLCVSALSGRLNPNIREIIWADAIP
jgi:hypothetical protein